MLNFPAYTLLGLIVCLSLIGQVWYIELLVPPTWQLYIQMIPLLGRLQVLLIGDSAYAVPTIKNCAFELSTFGIIVGVNPTEVQWKDLTLEEQPS